MRAVVQRVSQASVVVDQQTVGEIGLGYLILLGVEQSDESKDAQWLAAKVAGLRIFEDSNGLMNLDIQQVDGRILVVSQFTLLGDCRKGRRPSFVAAARPEKADVLYQEFCDRLRQIGIGVETGQFQTTMQVSLVNEGPVTMLLDSQKTF
ncbi:MAG: D-aminoacyl-tRNA deacylase [Fuerstiella sp.]